MSATPGGSPKIKPIYIIALVILVFVLSFIGHIQYLHGPEHHFSVWGVLYATTLFFFLHHADPEPHNTLILIAELLAMFLFLAGIFAFVFKGLRKTWLLQRIKKQYKGHVVILHLSKLTKQIAIMLAKAGYKVIVLEPHADNHYIEAVEKAGVIVLQGEHGIDSHLLADARLQVAATCIIAHDNDEVNMALATQVAQFKKAHQQTDASLLKILVHVQGTDNVDLLKDFFDVQQEGNVYDVETFNIHQMGAAKLYDLFPPHQYLQFEKEGEKSIAVIGFNATAERFLLEQVILSHYPEMENIKVYVIDENADTAFHQFNFLYPFHKEYIDIIPVKLINRSFFAHFSWNKDTIEKISKVRAVYIFGESDAALVNMANSFRQFLYTQTRQVAQVPIVVCLPEDTGVLDLMETTQNKRGGLQQLFTERLNIQYFKRISDVCTPQHLLEHRAFTDRQAYVLNYYYALLYDFEHLLQQYFNVTDTAVMKGIADSVLQLPYEQSTVSEANIEKLVLEQIAQRTGISYSKLYERLSIMALWQRLSNRKKDSNRYAARHIAVKLHSLQRIGCWPISKENLITYYPRLAPLEHKRWCAEKMVFNFKFGHYNTNERSEKALLKDVLKIHDQLIPYDHLTEDEKRKDLNIFLMLPLMYGLQKVSS